jgi:two-component sensor histidine kinase
VTDNGIGMPGDFNLQDTPSLGLQIVSLLTMQMAGEVEFTSNPGSGTSFTVTVPSSSLDGTDTPLQTPTLAIWSEEPSR